MPLEPSAADAPASAGRDWFATVKLWPGTVTPQPKPCDWKRANAIAFSTGVDPGGRVGVPFRSWARGGLSGSSGALVMPGGLSPSESSPGALVGAADSTPAAPAPCQSPLSTRATAGGRVPGLIAGNTALATPAASEAGSLPGTRVVFFVAVVGEPSCLAAALAFEPTPPARPPPPPPLFTEPSAMAS